jgi:hypothetical protein
VQDAGAKLLSSQYVDEWRIMMQYVFTAADEEA